MIGYYFDEHMKRDVASELIRRGYNVIMAVDSGMIGKDDDSEHLPFATQKQLVLVTFDKPFASRTRLRNDFFGLICLSNTLQRDVGRTIEVLVEFAELFDERRDAGKVYWLR